MQCLKKGANFPLTLVGLCFCCLSFTCLPLSLLKKQSWAIYTYRWTMYKFLLPEAVVVVHLLLKSRCTCTARVTVLSLSVCVSAVWEQLFMHYRLRGGLLLGFKTKMGRFSWHNCVSGIWLETSEKANMHNQHWLHLDCRTRTVSRGLYFLNLDVWISVAIHKCKEPRVNEHVCTHVHVG